VADLWFHSMLLLAQHGLKPADVLAELRAARGPVGAGGVRAAQGAQARGRVMAHEPDRPRNSTNDLSASLKAVGHVSYLLNT
jgi:hypothetical protein